MQGAVSATHSRQFSMSEGKRRSPGTKGEPKAGVAAQRHSTFTTS
jgi:hypothetical protein